MKIFEKNSELCRYIEERSRYFDVVLVFHCCCTSNEKIEEQIKSLLKSHDTILRISLFICEPEYFKYTQLSSYCDSLKFQYKNVPYKRLKHIRKDIVSLEWSDNALSVKCDVFSYRCEHTGRIKVIDYLKEQYDDHLGSELISNRITSFSYLCGGENDVDNSEIMCFNILNDANEILSEKMFQQMMQKKKKINFFEILFKLKREETKNVEDFKQQPQFDTKLLKEARLRLKEFELGDYDLDNETPVLRSMFKTISVKISGEKRIIFNPNKVIYQASLYDNESIWLELYGNDQLCAVSLEIFQMTSKFVKKFSELKSCEFTLKMSDTRAFKLEDLTFLGKTTNHLLDKYINGDNKAQDVSEAFSHFTYISSNKKLLIIDLQTISTKSKNEYFITEPVVFSTNCKRFGSSNLGKTGINLFMSLHNCNKNCNIFI